MIILTVFAVVGIFVTGNAAGTKVANWVMDEN